MAIATKITCDQCETEKKQVNHWILYLRSLPASPRGPSISFSPWSDELCRNEGIGHLCGAGCAGKLLNAEVQRWQAEAFRG